MLDWFVQALGDDVRVLRGALAVKHPVNYSRVKCHYYSELVHCLIQWCPRED